MSRAPTKQSRWGPVKGPKTFKYLSDLPWSVRIQISKTMDRSGSYVRLAGLLNYEVIDIDCLELEFKKGASPMMKLFEQWQTLNPTMINVFKYFKLAECYLEMEILKKYVPQDYHNELPRDPDEIDLDGIYGNEENGANGKKVAKPDPNKSSGSGKKFEDEVWKPSLPRENSWHYEEDSISEKKKPPLKFSDLDEDKKLTPTAPPPSLDPKDKLKDFGKDIGKDMMSSSQAPGSFYKCTAEAPGASLSSLCKPGKQVPSPANGVTDEEKKRKSQHEAFEKLSFATTPSFPFDEIRMASKDWSLKNVIGDGSFGTVYKVSIRRLGTTFAVKRMNKPGSVPKSKEDFEHFKTEITQCSMYKHANVILICGYAFGMNEICILYEYMAKGSLLDNLQCRNDLKPLLWKHRIEILRGASRGLLYLHAQDKEQPLIHGDIKSANILLDQNLVPKISDFGLARHAIKANEKGEITHVTVENTYMHGTSAYLPTSFVQNPTMKKFHQLSIKTDVHSFGVVIMETLTGLEAKTRDPKSSSMQEELLVDIVSDYYDDTKGLLGLCDKKPSDTYPDELLIDMFDLARQCTHKRKNEQPTMDVVFEFIRNIENRKVQINLNAVRRREQSAPPYVTSDPLKAELQRKMNRQQAIMATSRPDDSMQPLQSFQSGIPSFDPHQRNLGYPPKVFQSLPAQMQMSAAVSANRSRQQYSLRSDVSDVSDSADLYQSSESLHGASGLKPFEGIGGTDPHTPLPMGECSLTLTGHVVGGKPSSSNLIPPLNGSQSVVTQRISEHKPRVGTSLPNGIAARPMPRTKPDTFSTNGRQDLSLPPARVTRPNEPDHSVELRVPPGPGRQNEQQTPTDRVSDNRVVGGNNMPEIDEREKVLEKNKRKTLSDLFSDLGIDLPAPNVPVGQELGGEEYKLDTEDAIHDGYLGESHDADQMLPTRLENGSSPQEDEVSGAELGYQSLPAGKNSSDDFDDGRSYPAATGLSLPPTFGSNRPRACEESDDRDWSEEDMVLPAPSGVENLSQDFKKITVSSLSDSGEIQSITAPPGRYSPENQ